MKKILPALFLIGLNCLCHAQKENNIWYFGLNAGLYFNSGLPVPLLNGAINTTEGCTSMADTSGNILFYTEGINVYNRNNVAMPNGTGLMGGNSASESAIIVKQPGSNTLYYLFTVPDQGSNNGLRYSIIDITLNGGFGDITATKNILLHTPITEKLVAARHSNGTDFWIVSHELNSDAFYAYQLSSTGLNTTPVISNVGVSHGGNAIGYMKISHDASKLALAITYLDQVELFDFNNSTAVVSNPITFPAPNVYPQPYGLEFSCNNGYLYFAESGNAGGVDSLYQFDLNAGSPAAILASGLVVGGSVNRYLGPLQMGPDYKIYVGRYGTGYLGVINDPDIGGLGCNFVDSGVYLGGRSSSFGLPNQIVNCFASLPAAHFICSDTAFCTETGECIDFFDHSTGNPTSWQWIFTGAFPDTSTLQNPTNICYSSPGTYPVTLIVTNSNGSDTLAVTPLIIYGTAPAPPTITVISGDTLISSNAAHYQWYFNGSIIAGATDSFYVAHQGGTYAVQIMDSLGCNSLSNGMLITEVPGNQYIEQSIKLYPNPVSDELTIFFFTLPKGGGEAVIADMLGRELDRRALDKSKSEHIISVNGLSDGMYMLQIRLDVTTVNKKFVVLHK